MVLYPAAPHTCAIHCAKTDSICECTRSEGPSVIAQPRRVLWKLRTPVAHAVSCKRLKCVWRRRGSNAHISI